MCLAASYERVRAFSRCLSVFSSLGAGLDRNRPVCNDTLDLVALVAIWATLAFHCNIKHAIRRHLITLEHWCCQSLALTASVVVHLDLYTALSVSTLNVVSKSAVSQKSEMGGG